MICQQLMHSLISLKGVPLFSIFPAVRKICCLFND